MKVIPSTYVNSSSKRYLDFIVSSISLILLSPLIIVVVIIIKTATRDNAIFRQKRTGKNGKGFIMYKFQTMIPDADKKRKLYSHMNEADGPVFKIRNDPRFTLVGKILARMGIDELPQLINVIKGEMSIVGPRPLPAYESTKLSTKERQRLLTKPGIVSDWVILGTHNLSFRQWMDLDQRYVETASFRKDLEIMRKSVIFVAKLSYSKLIKFF